MQYYQFTPEQLDIKIDQTHGGLDCSDVESPKGHAPFTQCMAIHAKGYVV